MKFLLKKIAFLLIYTQQALAVDSITLGNGEWKPYQSKGLKHFGYASQIVSEAFASQGIEVKYKFYPWARALESAKKGAVDGTFLWGHKKERENDFLFSDPIVDVTYVFFYLKKKGFDWQDIEDLKDLNVGVTIKYSYGNAFDKGKERKLFKADSSKDDETNFKKLLKGRIDVTPNDLDAGLSILRRNHSKEEMESVAYHKKPVRSTPHYLMISKKNPKAEDILSRFNKGLKKLKDSGRFKEIVEASRRGNFVMK